MAVISTLARRAAASSIRPMRMVWLTRLLLGGARGCLVLAPGARPQCPVGRYGLFVRLLEGDDPMAAVLGEDESTQPGVDGADPVAPADQVQHVDEAPHEVGQETGDLQAEGVGHGGLVADGGHAALVEVLERLDMLVAGEPCLDQLADVLALLNRRLC